MQKVFVYGTLKRGFGNHRHFMRGATFLGEGTVVGHLYSRGVPFLVPGDGTVKGELYAVSEDDLARIDALEGHPHGYKRTPRIVTVGDNQFVAAVYVWQHDVHPDDRIPDGEYRPGFRFDFI